MPNKFEIRMLSNQRAFSSEIQNKHLHLCLFLRIKHIYINIYSTCSACLFKAWLFPSLWVSGKRIESKMLARSREWEKKPQNRDFLAAAAVWSRSVSAGTGQEPNI